jgi:putative spermidine/putrescine transport system ATP-binding protein
VRKRFDDTLAVDGINLTIEEGEFFSMLGPSGSGKTTVLRLIAGFERPDVGTIELFGRDVTKLAPFDRDVNTVFQDYALFPHMTVEENVGYGLRVRRISRVERRARIREALDRVQLYPLRARRPTELSGGQRQRVALARAIVLNPKALLLDEPLGALDLKLREEMQVELKTLQRSLGITFIFVTHDQDEALTLGDRVAVFAGGRIVQVGSAEHVYEEPADQFVAEFVGTSNLLEAKVAAALGLEGLTSVLRPERVAVGVSSAAEAINAEGTVAEVIFTGPSRRLVVDLSAGTRVTAAVPAHDRDAKALRPGDTVTLHFLAADVIPLPQ